MARPYWSGQFQLSLVSFGIQLFSATEAKSEIRFHQLNRKTGERIKHQNVTESDGPVEKEEIVKGYEYTKGEYVTIEPEDIESLRIPSRETFVVEQFVSRDQLHFELIEKPYFVTPANSAQMEAFAVVRKGMQASGQAALGKVAFGGREHLVAIVAPESDEQLGMMAYTLRYAEELRDASTYFQDIKRIAIDNDQLALARELIQRKSRPFDLAGYTDDYEAALRAMVEAKIRNLPMPKSTPAPKSTNVINLMDALRQSVQAGANDKPQRPAKSANGQQTQARKLKFPPQTVASAASKARNPKPASRRKSA